MAQDDLKKAEEGRQKKQDQAEKQVEFSVDVVTIVFQLFQVRQLNKKQIEYLTEQISVRMNIDAQKAEQQIRTALGPQSRNNISPLEEYASSRRFGIGRNDLEKRHADFVSRHGKKETIHLIEILVGLIKMVDLEEDRRIFITRIYQDAEIIGIDPLIMTAIFRKYGFNGHASSERFSLEGMDYLLVGRDSACDLSFFDPLVEEIHAELKKSGENWVVEKRAVSRPLWVDEQLVSRFELKEGSRIVVGPYHILFHYGTEGTDNHPYLLLEDQRSLSALSIRNLKRKIGDINLLSDISFTVFSGEVVALIGPSGAGKTTLLNAINGVAPADTGSVTFNGHDFHRLLTEDKSLVGIVPQDDLVLPELTVEESLFFSGRLRLHPSTPEEDIWKQVDRVLMELDIEHIRSQRIGDALRRGISGGQRKRVNLGQELISSTTQILFLDEPTSGLDPRASQEIVRLVRSLSDKGRIVFLVTHDLTDQIIGQVDNLLVLVKGGALAFYGRQRDALGFFDVEGTDKIFQQFGERQNTWPAKFKNHTICGQREIATSEFNLSETTEIKSVDIAGSISIFMRQLSTLINRYTKVKFRDSTGMLVIALQPPFLALVMAFVFLYKNDTGEQIVYDFLPTQSMLFMLSLSCLWFGMSAAVRELISDQVIFRRERRVGVRVLPYVLSKVVVLGLITAAQAVFLALVMYFVFDLKNYGFGLFDLTMVASLTAWVGMSLGLFISSVWRSSEAAVGTLPLILIPQIAFSSIMFSIRDMEPIAKFCTYFTFQRYTFDAFVKCGEDIAVRTRRGDFEHQPISGSLWRLGLKESSSAADVGYTLTQLYTIMGGITIVLLCACVVRMYYRDKDG
ncbi:MAG: hypothetical protein CMK59_04495 [Proteobacteria bacterium]|nr:hypothetical protein [Pseudomonadota bacterium]